MYVYETISSNQFFMTSFDGDQTRNQGHVQGRIQGRIRGRKHIAMKIGRKKAEWAARIRRRKPFDEKRR